MSKEYIRDIARLILAVAAAFSVSVTALADVVGRYGAEFAANGGGARALALGGAYTALADDAWSLFWNPSGLERVSSSQAGFMHSERFDGVVDYDAASIVVPQMDGSVVAVGIIRSGVNAIPFTRLEDPSRELGYDNVVIARQYVNEAEYALLVGRARAYGRFRLGLAPKLVFKHFGSQYTAYGLGADVGAGVKPFNKLPIEAGASVRDVLGTYLAWAETGRKEIIPPSMRIGLAAALNLRALEATLTAAADLSYRFEVLGASDAAALHAGAEYVVRDAVALRIGSDDGAVTFGGGLRLKPLSIDYAYITHDELGDTHRVSIVARWGKDR